MGKKILVIMGSPRKNGLTASLTSHFATKIDNLNSLETLTEDHKIEVEILNLVDFTVGHCIACDSCLRKPNVCPLSEKDDMDVLDKKMQDADAILVGSPSYFFNVPGILKDLIDRSRPLKMGKYKLKDKLFSVVSASGLQNGGHNAVLDVLTHWALIQGMIVISALGHPVIVSNFPSESGQMLGIKEFRKPSDLGEPSQYAVEALATRFHDLLNK
ncbi:flavodoxin family protein [Candidatus Lokiarchaeum ossiferum]|uniref:flavodoxin family protein n=1 Tax=Candidatus Lokiarchaeum ossiferum TaxID=2951803 RepID=UPI00352C94B1